MANIIDISTITGINQVGNSYQRKNPVPLDYYSFFNTRADAEEYAKNGAVAYVGQVIAFTESATDATVKVCVIKNEAGDLEALNNVEVQIPNQGTYITITTDNNGNYTIAHANAGTMTITPETEKKTTFVTEITRDDQGHITGYKTATVEIPDVTLDGKSIAKNDDATPAIELKGFKKAKALTVPQKNAAGTELEWVTIEGTDTKTVGDDKSIEAAATNVTGANVTLQIKGVNNATNGKVLKADGQGGVTWADDIDTNTKTGVKAGNDGIEVTLQTPADTGDDRTYVVSHRELSDEIDSSRVAEIEGEQSQRHINNVLVDEFGHVTAVEMVDEITYDIDVRGDSELNHAHLNLYNSLTEEPIESICIHGDNGLGITCDSDGKGITFTAPDVVIGENYEVETPTDDTVNVITWLQTGEAGTHTLIPNVVPVPTKAYVDHLVSGATSYYGTIASEEQLELASQDERVGRGDFLRVTQDIYIYDRDENGTPKFDDNGDPIILTTYHPSDMLICETAPIFNDEGKCTTLATWSIIHGEIDANTWVANTKDADGYVTKGKDDPNSVWATDKDGNPDWMKYVASASADEQDKYKNSLVQRDADGFVHSTKGLYEDGNATGLYWYWLSDIDREDNDTLLTVYDATKVIGANPVIQSFDNIFDTTEYEGGLISYNGTGKMVENAFGSDVAANKIVQRDANGQINVVAAPTADTHAASKKYVDEAITDAVDSIVMPTVNDGKFTVSGTGYLTGSGSMTANQAGDTTANLDLTQTAKDKIDNAMPKLPENARNNAKGHYAIFDDEGKVVDGGFLFAHDANQSTSSTEEVSGFTLYENMHSQTGLIDPTDAPLIGYTVAVKKDEGLTITHSYTKGDDSDADGDQSAEVKTLIELSDATKASLAKADNAMPKVPGAGEGHYAVFDANGQVVDGGYLYGTAQVNDVKNGSEDTVIGTSVVFAINEHGDDNKPEGSIDNPVLFVAMEALDENGIKLTKNSITSPPFEYNGNTADATMNLVYNIGLTDDAKASLEKADTAVQEITTKCTNTDTTYHTKLKCTTSGLKVTQNKDADKKVIPGSYNIELDDSITFILNCGTAADLLK